MTRRTIALTLAAAALAASAATPGLRAQSGENRLDTRPLVLYVNIGYVNLFTYPKWIALGPELELRFGKRFSINPECSIWARDSFRGGVSVIPGATVNLRFKRFFVGGGAVRRVSDWGESASGWLVPKVQAGYFSGPSRLAVTLMYLNRSNDVAVGLTLGIGIGRRPGS